jgi:integrase
MLELTDYVAGKSTRFIARRRPGNKGRRYPADPPRVEEIVAVMRQAGTGPYGQRLRGLIIVLWRAGLRISEALALAESDLEANRGSVLVRRGKGGLRREVGMDEWAWNQLRPWLEARVSFPIRTALLRDQWADLRPALVKLAGPSRASTHRAPGRHTATIRSTPAAPRPCSGDGQGRRTAERHSAPAGTCQPRRDFDLPTGHR